MSRYDVVIVGGGFTGLAAAYELGKLGKRVVVLERDESPGGLAGTFHFSDGVTVEKFYHHWFNNDVHVPELVREIGAEEDIVLLPSRTGMFLNGRLWKLSTPVDLLRFTALSFLDRVRLGLLVFRVRQVTDWREIEHLSIREWLEPLCGNRVYEAVWGPLVEAKFSVFSEAVNAVWMWKKLVLRGGTRDGKGSEVLAYFKGGFGRLSELLVYKIREQGSDVVFGATVTGVHSEGGRLTALQVGEQVFIADHYLFTPAFPIIADIFEGTADTAWLESIRRVNYLGNVCLVLRLSQSLSETYWINVNDPGFPFVGVIEHTNFDSPKNYGGDHIIYLSRYVSTEDEVWSYEDDRYLDYALKHLTRMFPKFSESWIVDYKIWRADFAQPITERNYSTYVPPAQTPFANASMSTMAHIYPEDRGTNYAIREGKAAATRIGRMLDSGSQK